MAPEAALAAPGVLVGEEIVATATVIASPASQHDFEYRTDGHLPYQSGSGEIIFLDDEAIS
ncbi:hypothetical protein [Microbacterium sp. H83]|uniref:hypothetical protein n=1 Tax=Microbacterium sp. H83 TaxID=1827324 RepID=UPI0007F506D4|nr:hypothetical protein [Microbacterium sp. H83]OAN33382.1 hypothetical protein A4X16_06870 [Microbacterium sp. H83]